MQRVGKVPYAETKLSKSLTENALDDERLGKQRSETNMRKDHIRERKKKLAQPEKSQNMLTHKMLSRSWIGPSFLKSEEIEIRLWINRHGQASKISSRSLAFLFWAFF